MWQISKDFDFCYGHRIHSQNLEKSLSCGAEPKCLRLHGHNGTIKVTLEGYKLDKRGFVLDFVELNWFKKFVDDYLDHRFIIDKNDPMISYILTNNIGSHIHEGYVNYNTYPEGFTMYSVREGIDLGTINKLVESFVIVDFVPTSENFSKWLYNIVDNKMKQFEIKTSSVQFFETPKSNSLYRE